MMLANTLPVFRVVHNVNAMQCRSMAYGDRARPRAIWRATQWRTSHRLRWRHQKRREPLSATTTALGRFLFALKTIITSSVWLGVGRADKWRGHARFTKCVNWPGRGQVSLFAWAVIWACYAVNGASAGKHRPEGVCRTAIYSRVRASDKSTTGAVMLSHLLGHAHDKMKCITAYTSRSRS